MEDKEVHSYPSFILGGKRDDDEFRRCRFALKHFLHGPIHSFPMGFEEV